MGKRIIALLFMLVVFNPLYAQFGKNKVQYKEFTWYYIQTRHFDIYFSQGGEQIAEFAAKATEDALSSIERSFQYAINNRISFILYKSTNDFQETNVTDEYLEEGIGGFTELFKNRVVLPFDGSYSNFRHVIHHELVHAVINDMFYGGSLQNIISKNINVQLPLWFNEGMAEYQSLGWDSNTDMFIRDAIINEYMPDIYGLNGYFAYRGGQAVFNYISQRYGREKISEIINKTKSLGDFEEGLKASIGLNSEELNDRWKKELKKTYWPDIAKRDDPEVFAKKLTNKKKQEFGGNYNIGPAISPQGDKIAFISNRNFYFDVFIMNAADGKILKRIVEGNRSSAFEELNILTPGLTWSPDGNKIALAAKSGGYDIIYLIDVESEDKEVLPVKMGGISSVKWSSDGKLIAFSAHSGKESDVYLYNLETKELKNLTEDIFTDTDPAFSNDGKFVFFSSDRGGYVNRGAVADTFNIFKFNYHQTDLYAVELSSMNIVRITDIPNSDENNPVISPDGKELLFISGMNGINNIFKKRINLSGTDSLQAAVNTPAEPITNSLNGLYQLSLSADGKKLVFSSLFESAYNVFLMINPFESKTPKKELEPTEYMASLIKSEKEEKAGSVIDLAKQENTGKDTSELITSSIYLGQVTDTAAADTSRSKSADFSRYVFGDKRNFLADSLAKASSPEFNPKDNFDSSGNYVVNKYKISFSPDIIYANAGYSTLYGLLGTTVLSFSDLLGNHRLIGVTSLQIDLKNSDYGLAYYYLPKRIDYGIEGFHTARFVYLTRGYNSNLFRFRNYGAVVSASLPLNKFYRFEGSLSWLNVSSENLDNIDEPSTKVSYVIPSLSFVKDNVLWGYTSPIDGTRYNLTGFGNPFGSRNFYSFVGDYRNYTRFWYDYSFVFRLSGGYSGGAAPQRFFIGGTENWINRSFATGDIPLRDASDFAFLTPALPLRGYNYAEQMGTRYGLLNLELRMPLIRYLVTGPIPILFQNILGVAFVDMGAAWGEGNHKKLQLFTKENGNLMSKDLLTGTGFGARMFFLYFLLRFDVAWSYDFDHFSKPKYYFSLGADF